VPLDDQHSWAVLRQLDDPDHMEYPRGYDHGATRAKFDQLAARLDQRFDCACSVDRHVQDASHHGRIVIPAAVTDSRQHIVVTVSNFGNLAVVSLGRPGSYDEKEERKLFQSTDRHRVEGELEALGYIIVSEHLLWTPYDGVSDLVSYYPLDQHPSWWTRYFDYL